MSHPRYPAYRDSGVEWLGCVPEHWAVSQLGYRYDVQLGKMLDEKRISGTLLAPYLRNIDVQWDSINVTDLPSMDFDEEDRDKYRLEPGDVLVCEGGEVGRAAIWQGAIEECYYQKALHRLRPGDATADVSRFLYYTLYLAAKQGRFSAGGNVSTIEHLTAEKLRKYKFAFPPCREQCSIASFLDRETARIAALIAEQERLIALLREKRQALIAQAVTKGLNPDAPMKGSGVEWLGEIPAHWDVKRLKTCLTSISQGWSPQCENRPADEDEWGVLKVGCVNGERFNPLENKALPADLTPLEEHVIRSGDVLVSRANTRELVGSAALVMEDYPRLLLCDKLYRLRFTRDSCLPEYAALLLRTAAARCQFEIAATGASSSMMNIAQETVKSLLFAFPPIREQCAILGHVHQQTATLDRLTTETEQAVALLQEHRASLISAAVTGQIDVRAAVLAGAAP